jgi:GGDEF domain-containing protein
VRSSERFAVEALRKLIDEIGAASGVLELHEGEQRRRIAMVGAAVPGPDVVPAEAVFAPDRFVVPMDLRPGVQAVLALTPPSGTVFSKESALVTREAAAVLRLWLAGSVQSSAAAPEKPAVDWAFLERVTEELNRAKRFDLSLSMLLLDLDPTESADEGTVGRVIDLVREELRCSDLLGPVGPGRIAVLLVHTDVRGVNSVMPRVRRRMEDGLRSVGVPALKIGRAVLSDDCRTAAALMTQASHDVDTVVVN